MAEPGTSSSKDYRHDLRASIARELHDGPIQALTSCVLRLERFRMVSDSPAMQSAITEVEGDARMALTSLRHIIRDLRDEAPLEDLAGTIMAMAGTYQGSTGTEVTVVASPEWPELIPADVAVNLLRVVQEAMTNATRHGHARHILLELKIDDDLLVVSISDDGTGIAPGTPPGGGLIGMRERAALIGGRLVVRHRHPGTEIRVEAPAP